MSTNLHVNVHIRDITSSDVVFGPVSFLLPTEMYQAHAQLSSMRYLHERRFELHSFTTTAGSSY